MIAELRNELTTAMRASAGEQIRFQRGPVELRVVLDIKRAVGEKSEIKFFVASLEGKSEVTNETKHRIKVQLQPVSGNDGGSLTLASESSHRPP
jgi:hypothetical protein